MSTRLWKHRFSWPATLADAIQACIMLIQERDVRHLLQHHIGYAPLFPHDRKRMANLNYIYNCNDIEALWMLQMKRSHFVRLVQTFRSKGLLQDSVNTKQRVICAPSATQATKQQVNFSFLMQPASMQETKQSADDGFWHVYARPGPAIQCKQKLRWEPNTRVCILMKRGSIHTSFTAPTVGVEPMTDHTITIKEKMSMSIDVCMTVGDLWLTPEWCQWIPTNNPMAIVVLHIIKTLALQ